MGKLDISKVLTVSTKNISAQTADFLEKEVVQASALCVYDMEGYAWWIHIPDCVQVERSPFKELPEDLKSAIKLAQDNDCLWLCLDIDGEVVEELSTFEW